MGIHDDPLSRNQQGNSIVLDIVEADHSRGLETNYIAVPCL